MVSGFAGFAILVCLLDVVFGVSLCVCCIGDSVDL